MKVPDKSAEAARGCRPLLTVISELVGSNPALHLPPYAAEDNYHLMTAGNRAAAC